MGKKRKKTTQFSAQNVFLAEEKTGPSCLDMKPEFSDSVSIMEWNWNENFHSREYQN